MSVTDQDRQTAEAVYEEWNERPNDIVKLIAAALAAEREKARAPFLAILDIEPDMQPLWEFERGALRGIEMAKAAIRKAAEQ